MWDWVTGNIGTAVGAIVGAVTAVVSGNLWLGFQAYSMTSSVINASMSGNWGGLAGGIAGGLIGGMLGQAAGLAGGSLFSNVNTFAAGFAEGSIKLGMSGFGSGFGYALGSGESFGDSVNAGLVSGAVSGAIGGVLQGAYQADWQGVASGTDMGAIGAAKADMLLKNGYGIQDLAGLDAGLRSRAYDPVGIWLHGTDKAGFMGINSSFPPHLREGSYVTTSFDRDPVTGKLPFKLNASDYARYAGIQSPKGSYLALAVGKATYNGIAKGGQAPEYLVDKNIAVSYPNPNR